MKIAKKETLLVIILLNWLIILFLLFNVSWSDWIKAIVGGFLGVFLIWILGQWNSIK